MGCSRYVICCCPRALSLYLHRTLCSVDGGDDEDKDLFFLEALEVYHHLAVGNSHSDIFCHFLPAVAHDGDFVYRLLARDSGTVAFLVQLHVNVKLHGIAAVVVKSVVCDLYAQGIESGNSIALS